MTIWGYLLSWFPSIQIEVIFYIARSIFYDTTTWFTFSSNDFLFGIKPEGAESVVSYKDDLISRLRSRSQTWRNERQLFRVHWNAISRRKCNLFFFLLHTNKRYILNGLSEAAKRTEKYENVRYKTTSMDHLCECDRSLLSWPKLF